jgi:hypothetical protein
VILIIKYKLKLVCKDNDFLHADVHPFLMHGIIISFPENNGTDFGFDISALIHGNHEKNDFINGSSSYNAQFM